MRNRIDGQSESPLPLFHLSPHGPRRSSTGRANREKALRYGWRRVCHRRLFGGSRKPRSTIAEWRGGLPLCRSNVQLRKAHGAADERDRGRGCYAQLHGMDGQGPSGIPSSGEPYGGPRSQPSPGGTRAVCCGGACASAWATASRQPTLSQPLRQRQAGTNPGGDVAHAVSEEKAA